ncbi:MAG: hypothetical protein EOP56_10090 [Sphingobacteriales bacterium]|nr:MAG: hypothetical protein EOP56_10090 [Sphingobacteriales bacterium]
MTRKNNENEQTKGAQQGNIDQDRDLGNKSQRGTTSTNSEKSRLQQVENNDFDGVAEGSGGTRTTETEERGTYSTENNRNGMDDNRSGQSVSDSSFVDSGYTRTAAFDEGGEPRSPESLEHRGRTEGSDDHAGTIRTTNYGPDIRGGRSSESRGGTPGGDYRSSDSVGRMRD